MYSQEITYQLNLLGMSHKIKGYKYCRESVNLMIHSERFVQIEQVYSAVAEKFHTNEICVERNIRYAIEKTWENGDIAEIDKMFGFSVSEQKGKPTNMEFLFMITDRIRNISA